MSLRIPFAVVVVVVVVAVVVVPSNAFMVPAAPTKLPHSSSSSTSYLSCPKWSHRVGQPRLSMTSINGSSSTSSTSSSTTKLPQPPSTPPPLSEEFYQQALQEYGGASSSSQQTTTTTVDDLESRVATLQRELAAKEVALEQQQEQWDREKAQLLGQLLENGGGDQAAPELVVDAEDAQERERLERELELLQGQLPAVQNKLRTEQRRSEQLEERLADLDYTLEYQQMEFEKIQQQAVEELEQEKKKLSQLQAELSTKEIALQEQLTSKEKELQLELERMREVESSLKGNQKAFAEEKARLVVNLQEKQSKLSETEEALQKEQQLFDSDRKELQAEIVAERMRLAEAETFLNEAEQLYRDIEKDLGDQLKKERAKVADLSVRLEAERAQFQAMKEELDARLLSQEASVSELQSTLEKERLESTQEIHRLTLELNNEIRIGKLKKRQMNDRFNAIRSEMTDLWQGALRDGRKQVQEFQLKYDKKVAALQTSVIGLEEELSHALKEKESLTMLLRDMALQRDNVEQAKATAEKQYQLVGETKTKEIGVLRDNLQALKQQMASEQEETTKFRGSVRSMIKETVGLAAKRVVVKPMQRLGRVFQRKK